MSTIARKGQEFEKINPGNYQSVAIAVYDLGVQKTVYKGEEKVKHQIAIQWEVNEREIGGTRFTIVKFYTNSLGSKSNLRNDLKSWRGKDFTDVELEGFDLDNLIGVNCLLNIIKTEKDSRVVASISPLPAGMQKMAAETVINKIPEWLKKIQDKKIADSMDAVFNTEIPQQSGSVANEQQPSSVVNKQQEEDVPF